MPAVSTSIYDPATYVTNQARIICNDAGLTIAGELLADTQPFTTQLLNMAYRDLQEDLTNDGVETMAQEAVLVGITPAALPTDPGSFVNVSYTGYNDGQNNFATPTLPPDMLGPLVLAERMTGSLQCYFPMNRANDGLPSRAKWTYNREWEWRSDAIWMVGATQSNDIRLRYNKVLPELVLGLNPSTILIARADRAIAYRMAAIFSESRGPEATASLQSQYENAKRRIVSRTAHGKQRANHRRRPYSEARHEGWGDII